eukprot:m.397040 g.397040  ORF g.397040 m.397040 type:complete len:721 (+) comp21120_c2_seq2:281-2443(+)
MPSRAGDVKNSLANLRAVLRKIKFSGDLDVHGAKQGSPEVFLPLIHYAFLAYSEDLARFLGRSGYELYGKSDLKFMEGIYRVLRDEFNYTPKLNKRQFFSSGFAEQKMIFVTDVVNYCINKHTEIVHEHKVAGMSASGPPGQTHHFHRHQHHDRHNVGHDDEPTSVSVRSRSQSPVRNRHQRATDVLQRSHAELGPRSDDPSVRTVHGDGKRSGNDNGSPRHTDTIVQLTRSPSAHQRHNAQIEAAMQAAGVTVERSGHYGSDYSGGDGDSVRTADDTTPAERLQPQPLPPHGAARGGVDLQMMLPAHTQQSSAQSSHHPYSIQRHPAPLSTVSSVPATTTPMHNDASTAQHMHARETTGVSALLHSGGNKRPSTVAGVHRSNASGAAAVAAGSPLRHEGAAPHGRTGAPEAVPIETFYVRPASDHDHATPWHTNAPHGSGRETGGVSPQHHPQPTWTTVPLHASSPSTATSPAPAVTHVEGDGGSTAATTSNIVQTMHRLTQFVGALTSRIAVVEQHRRTAAVARTHADHGAASHDALVAEVRDNARGMHERLDMLHSDVRLNLASISARMTLLESKVTALEHGRSDPTSGPPPWMAHSAPRPDRNASGGVGMQGSNTSGGVGMQANSADAAVWRGVSQPSPVRREYTPAEASLHDVNTTLEHLEQSALHQSACVHTPPRPGDASVHGFRPPSTSSPKSNGGGFVFNTSSPAHLPMQPL